MQRRRFLHTLAAGAAAVSGRAARGAPQRVAPRVVVLDWGLAETLLALGVVPAGVAEIGDYNANVVTPRVPPGVPDVGLRLAPSLEWLAQLAPDLILINSSQASQRDMLERIAPVRAFAVYTDAGAPYARAESVTRELGALCHCEAAAETLIAQTAQALAINRAHLASAVAPMRPLYLIRFFDARHIGVYGARSLFQDVLDTLGVANAWRGPTDYWGIGVAPLEALAATPDARVLYFDPLPPDVARTLASNRLWRALTPIAHDRVAALPPFWGFGMLPSARRFGDALTQALLAARGAAPPVTGMAYR
ncbi:ABC transporter substrate-binding protein [Paraburkholderia sp. J76]|uniref:ABC transporter substrate-binding protein n=1 Tax=Paraburkholderia sp. J76 TaxID=2805439 RepID=UPI002ABD91D6|nr:ABC transporter substrate-binding protein [Paraburkholderia sp. J76]